jgi:hypothetical protein
MNFGHKNCDFCRNLCTQKKLDHDIYFLIGMRLYFLFHANFTGWITSSLGQHNKDPRLASNMKVFTDILRVLGLYHKGLDFQFVSF